MATTSKLRPAEPVSDSGALPPDALFEVLLRLPAKELCRLRVICRSWRALTCDPQFAEAHKSRHREPLFASIFQDGDSGGVAIFDMSGKVLRQIRFASERIAVLRTYLDRICVIRECKPSLGAWVVNPATGSALALPGLDSDEYLRICTERTFALGSVITHYCRTVTYAFGQVASTGDYKVLRISHPDRSQPLLCDIITLDGNSLGGWRRKQNPPGGLMRKRDTTSSMDCFALNGVVYFPFEYTVMGPGSIAPFHLGTEEWMPAIRGPEPLRSIVFRGHDRTFSLASLDGKLVTIDNVIGVSFDLWFLMDHEQSLWVKKYRLSIKQHCEFSYPLLVLDDGRIVIFERIKRVLQCYDPTTGSLTNALDMMRMRIGVSQSIGVYTGSLLI